MCSIFVSQQDPTCHQHSRLGVCVNFAAMECLSCPVLLRDFVDDESDQEWTAHKVRLQVIFEQTVLQAIFPNST
ncbi:hypothetical protein PILCRDRAFT_190923 [Piloderma croceum F 1598]|uniref:Uncharacterized protein n=1 Tax=Piloderma croceum (strain F 1598) TaxID=765440 RepID=A0A0C3BSQ1_PILCF|nr:hypothetical protein PILCRDRAFT_190923 [Piloderma croceum F 1598]